MEEKWWDAQKLEGLMNKKTQNVEENRKGERWKNGYQKGKEREVKGQRRGKHEKEIRERYKRDERQWEGGNGK